MYLLVVLTAAASLREFWPLSWVLPFHGSGTCLAFVPRFEAPLESLTHSIPRSFLVQSLSTYAVGLADALLLCPERTIRLFLCFCLVCRSRSQCRPSSAVSSLTVSVLCERSLLWGVSPHALGSVGVHGVRGGSTYIALHRSWSVSAILMYATWSSGRCLLLFLRDVPHVFMAINLSVYLTYMSPRLKYPVGLYYLDT